MRRPFLIDTDMAFDDWMAILYLLQSPEVEVRAITVAATGEAHAAPGLYHAHQLVSLCQSQPLPVAAGRATPLAGNQRFPWFVRLAMDLRLGLKLPKPRPGTGAAMRTLMGKTPTNAVNLMAQQLAASPHKVTVVALGPLTNLAELALAHPDLLSNVEMIYVMGGAFKAPGNIAELNRAIDNPYAEWNIFIDPHAAAVVFNAGAPITLVPLDVSNQAPISLAFYERARRLHQTAAADFIFRILRRLHFIIRRNQAYFWDPITAVIATDNSIASFANDYIHVLQKPLNQLGRTVTAAEGAPIRICTAIDQRAFEELYWTTVNLPGH